MLLRAPREIPNLRLFVRTIMRVHLTDPDRTYAIGQKGQADLWGLYRGGLHIELELKTAKGTMLKRQLAWEAFCRGWDIPHFKLRARVGESAEETVGRWCGEIRAVVNRSPGDTVQP